MKAGWQHSCDEWERGVEGVNSREESNGHLEEKKSDLCNSSHVSNLSGERQIRLADKGRPRERTLRDRSRSSISSYNFSDSKLIHG